MSPVSVEFTEFGQDPIDPGDVTVVVASVIVNINLMTTDQMFATFLGRAPKRLENPQNDPGRESVEEMTERVGVRSWVASLIEFGNVRGIAESVLVAPAVRGGKFDWRDEVAMIIARMSLVQNGSEDVESTEARARHSVGYVSARRWE